MADGLKSTCVVQDPTGQKCNVSVYFDPGLIGNWFDKSDGLKTLIEAYSTSKVAKRSDNYSAPSTTVAKGNIIGKYGTVDFKLIVILREDWTGKTRKLEIPSPKDDLFKQVEEQGLRLLEVHGIAIATAYSGLLPSGKTVGFVRGWLKSKA